MKKFLLTISLLFLLSKICFAVPTTTIAIPNSFSPNTVISSSAMNANFSEVSTEFNTHNHTDITQLGTVTTGNWNATAVTVTYGGTGVATLTDGGLLLGSGTDGVTALAVAENGEIPIGDGDGDPVLNTITGETNEITVTAAAGEIVVGLLDPVLISRGGTGSGTQTGGFDNLAPTTTQGDIMYHNGTDNVRLGAGTSGQVLTTQGAASNPKWAGAGGWANIEAFTADGTWDWDADEPATVYVKVWGAGGNGAAASVGSYGGGGGGGGGYSEGLISVTGDVTVDVGTTAASTSSFAGGVTIQATGGGSASGATGGAAGAGSNGELNLTGSVGTSTAGAGTYSDGGDGGSSPLGGAGGGGGDGGVSGQTGFAGQAGCIPGGGGGGGGQTNNSGGAFAPGLVIVYWN